MSVEQRLRELSITLPAAPAPLAAYVPAVRTGNLLFIAGQGPVSAGKATIVGQVGADVDEALGQAAARQAVLNALAIAAADLGSLDRVTRVVKLTGYVNCIAGFARQHIVVNGASELLLDVFGDAGRHARTSVGVGSLPFNIPVEIDLVLEFSA